MQSHRGQQLSPISPRERSAATMNASSPARSAINVVLPPGAEHRSSTRSPGLTSITSPRVARLRPVNKSHPLPLSSRTTDVAPATRHAPSTIFAVSIVAPASLSLANTSASFARVCTTRNVAGGTVLFARANASASSTPNELAQRSINQTGCEVRTAIFSSGSTKFSHWIVFSLANRTPQHRINKRCRRAQSRRTHQTHRFINSRRSGYAREKS